MDKVTQVLSIFAFATVSTSAQVSIKVHCTNTTATTISIPYSYPFNIRDSVPPINQCGESSGLFGNFSPAAQFFCFVGVMSFLICLFLIGAYIVFSQVFSKNSRAALIDFISSCVWATFWFIASCAWADNLSKLGAYMDPKNVIVELHDSVCRGQATCKPGSGPDHATLVVSVLFGFLNFALWCAGLWFLFKETQWHKESDDSATTFDQPQAAQVSQDTSGTSDGGYQAPTY